jgi:hypothetical protein
MLALELPPWFRREGSEAEQARRRIGAGRDLVG